VAKFEDYTHADCNGNVNAARTITLPLLSFQKAKKGHYSYKTGHIMPIFEMQ
jgi:hypothetical protein